MVAPSLVMMTSPLAVEIILSIPLGPRLVLTASATAQADLMLAWRMSSFRLLSTYDSVLEDRGADFATSAIDCFSKP
jgi:hypothetical protein